MKNVVVFLAVSAVLTGAQSQPIFSTFDQALVQNLTRSIEIVEEDHLKTDDGFKAAVLYLQGKEWAKLVDQVLKSPAYEDFEKMLQKYKFSITQAISCLRTHIDSLKVVPATVTAKPNLEPFLLDIQKALPLDLLTRALAQRDTPEAMRVRAEVGSKENQKIVEKLHNLPAMVKMREILKEMNFDVQPYITLAYAYLGWVK